MSSTIRASTEGLTEVAKASDISEGSMIGVAVRGRPILVSRIGGKFYAMDAICSHFFGYLPSGHLSGDTVVCPVHKAEFNITNGKVTKNVPSLVKLVTKREATELKIYEVVVEEDRVMIRS